MSRINWKGIREIVKDLVLTSPRWRFPTVRSLFYHIADTLKLIPLTEYGYKKIDEIAVELRKRGKIPFEYFEVKRGENGTLGRRMIDVDWLITYQFNRLLEIPKEYELPLWYGQPYHVEVWIEKKGLLPTFEYILSDLDVKVRAGEGYPSWEWVYANVKDIKKYLKERTEGKVVILYFGDLDPSGVDISRFVKEAIEFFGVDLEFRRVALYPEQVYRYNLPLWPEKMETIEKLMKDPRRRRYFEKYGEIACELDSFVSKAFDELTNLVRSEVMKYFSKEHLENRNKLEKAIRKVLIDIICKYENDIERLKTTILNEIQERLSSSLKGGGELCRR